MRFARLGILLGILLTCLSAQAGIAATACMQSEVILPRVAGATRVVFGETRDRGMINTLGQEVTAAAYSPNGQHIYVIRDSNLLSEVDASTGDETRTLRLSGAGRHIAISHDGSVALISSTETEGVLFVDLDRLVVVGHVELTAYGHTLTPSNLVFSPDGQFAYVSAQWGGTTWVTAEVDVSNRLQTRIGVGGVVKQSIAITSDARYLIVLFSFTRAESKIRVLDRSTLTVVRSINVGYEHDVSQIATTNNPRLVYVADSTDGRVRVIDIETGVEERTLAAGGSISSLSVADDGSLLMVGAMDSSYSQVVWRTINALTGELVSEGVSNDSGGRPTNANSIVCPRALVVPTSTTSTTIAPSTTVEDASRSTTLIVPTTAVPSTKQAPKVEVRPEIPMTGPHRIDVALLLALIVLVFGAIALVFKMIPK